MITEKLISDIEVPFREGIEWPFLYPFSPFVFRDKYLQRKWTAFDETPYPNMTMDIDAMFHKDVLGEHWYEIHFDQYGYNQRVLEYKNPTNTEREKLANEYPITSAIRWNDRGLIVWNDNYDFLITNMKSEESLPSFFCDIHEIYKEEGGLKSFWAESKHGSVEERDALRDSYNRVADDIEKTWQND